MPTTWVSAAETLPVKPPPPGKLAVIECDPTESVVVVKIATPPVRAPVPMALPASRNVTVPVGVPPPVTVAVKVTA